MKTIGGNNSSVFNVSSLGLANDKYGHDIKKFKGGVSSYDDPSSYDPSIIGLNKQFPCKTNVVNGFNPLDTPETYNYQQSMVVGGRKNKSRGGVAPYERYINYDDILDVRHLELSKKKYEPLDPGQIDERGTNFALSTEGGMKRRNKKGGNLFTNVSMRDLYTVDHLGHKDEYKPLNITNLDERGTNFALQQENKTSGGGHIKNKKLIDKYIHKILIKSFNDYKNKRMHGGSSNPNSSFLGDLLVNSFKGKNEGLLKTAMFNDKYLGNDKPHSINEPTKIYTSLQSNFEF